MKTSQGTESPANWPYPTLFAHRGGGVHAPENTLAGMKAAHQHSYAAVEFDVKLSADGIAMLLHDATLERTTNGAGEVAGRTMRELEALDAGSWFGPAFKDERIPRFSAVAKYLHGLGLMANVEIKPCAGREADTGRMIGELCVELWKDRFVKPLISSFSVPALKGARAAAPLEAMGLLVEQPTERHFEILEDLGCVSIHCRHDHVDADLVKRFHAGGYRVMAYTVNDIDRLADLLALGVDGVFTDQLEMMARRFPHQLNDAGKPMSDPMEINVDWQAVVPPMP